MIDKGPAFSSRLYVGPSTAFDAPHLLLESVLPLPRARWPDLLAASIEVANRLGPAVAGGDFLKASAAAVAAMSPEPDPWSAWIGAFGALLQIPEWRQQVESREDGAIVLWIACPYVRTLNLSAAIALRLLRLAERFLEDERVEAKIGAWEEALALLGSHLPDPQLMRLHAALGRQRLYWEWQGADSTSVGHGSRKTLLRGAPADIELEVRRLREMDLEVPIYAVTGSFGKTTTARLLAQLVETSGLRLAMQASDGAWAGEKQVFEGDCIDGRAARSLLRRSDVDAAVLEFGRGGLIDHGFPFPRIDVAVLLNVEAFHLGTDGIDTLDEMAEVKALVVKPARVAVLNLDDAQCRRIGDGLEASARVWFSTCTAREPLRHLSEACGGALGVARDGRGSPVALEVWRGGRLEATLSLDGVAPYQGMLGEKTLEELLAAVAAAWFGPVHLPDLQALLPKLRLDNSNHRFRTSSHRRGNLLFVLDKAAEPASLSLLEQSLRIIGERNGVARRIAVITRSAGELAERNLASCRILHPLFDEFICFDRPESYSGSKALPGYRVGSIPLMLASELERLNRQAGVEKPVQVAEDWDEAEARLRTRLSELEAVTLVLINQPTSVAAPLNARIISFVEEMTGGEA